jgi:hypothetical protein
MAGFGTVHSVGHSLITYLSDLYPQVPTATLPACDFQLVSSGQLIEFSPTGTVVTAYLFRIGIDPYLRNTGAAGRPADPETRPLALELHYLFTAWADNAMAEQAVLSWVMLQLHQRPLLDRSIVTAEGGWEIGDQVRSEPRGHDAGLGRPRSGLPPLGRLCRPRDPDRPRDDRSGAAGRGDALRLRSRGGSRPCLTVWSGACSARSG